ncbi:unnamed protein product, partial [Mesorhabditis spiculigera]
MSYLLDQDCSFVVMAFRLKGVVPTVEQLMDVCNLMGLGDIAPRVEQILGLPIVVLPRPVVEEALAAILRRRLRWQKHICDKVEEELGCSLPKNQVLPSISAGNSSASSEDSTETRSVDAPPGEDSYERNITLRMPGGSDAQSRLLDKLTRGVRCREFYPAQAPPQLTALPMFCRGNLAIHPELGPETRLGERYFEMDSWMWPGLKPDQAYLFSRDLRPEEYLDIYLDAFQKLINCPVVRLMQCYENEAECIAALPTIQQLFEAIIQAPRIEREDGRRLVIVDIQRRGQEFHMKGKTRIWDKVEMPELAAKYATMMKAVRAVMDSRQPNDVQLYQADLPSPRIYYTVPRTPTTANLIIAQNYASPWQVYAQILQSNTRDRNETMPPLRRLWPRPTDDAM